MALWMISLIWDLIGIWKGDSFWWNFSYLNILVSLVVAILTLITGLIDYVKVPQGAAEGVALRHMVAVLTATALFAGSFFVRFADPILSGNRLLFALGFSLLGVVFLLIGGWYGGELVYQYDVGKMDTEQTKQD
jgi:uncharacterized membrane protein